VAVSTTDNNPKEHNNTNHGLLTESKRERKGEGEGEKTVFEIESEVDVETTRAKA